MSGLGFLVIVAVLGLLWALLIRPQRRRQSQQQQMLADLAIGDEILTAGGIYGTVNSIDADELSVEVAPGTKVRVAKRAVAAVLAEKDDGDEVEEPEEPVENPTSAEQKHG